MSPVFLSTDITSNSKLAFAYGFYIICNIKYEDSESEETCEKCNSRERSLGQIFGLDSKMKGTAIITCSNVRTLADAWEKLFKCFVYCGCKDDPEIGKDDSEVHEGTTNYGASLHSLPHILQPNGTGDGNELVQHMEEIGQKLTQNRKLSAPRGSLVSMQPDSSKRNSRTTRNSLIEDYRRTQQERAH